MDLTTATGVIDNLVGKLTPIGQHVWEIYVRQKMVEGIVYLIAALVLIAVMVAINVVVWRRKKTGDYDNDTNLEIARVGAFVASVISFLVAGVTIVSALVQLLNPEYYALQSLLGH